jgi:glyoxylase I family protein
VPQFPSIGHVAVTVTDLERSTRCTGLDHVSFACRDRGELQTWAARLDELGIPQGEIVHAHYGSGLSFRDPDGIALEFFAPPQ